MTRPVSRSLSRAVLIGTSRYSHPGLPDIPAVASNLLDVEQALASSSTSAFAPEHCTVVADPVHVAEIGEVVARSAREAEDVLLIYFAGHGLVDNRGRLHLGLLGSDPNHLAWSAVPFAHLREEIVESPARTRILILDCCFSGRALEAMSDVSGAIAGQTDVDGTYTIVSSGANDISAAPSGHRNTAFTSALLTAAAGSVLTLDELYVATARLLHQKGHPRPKRRSVDAAGNLRLFGGLASHAPLTDDEVHRTKKLERAAAAGDCGAMLDLGRLLHHRGDLSGARTWCRRAAFGGTKGAAHGLGAVLLDQQQVSEAQRWFLSGAETGDPEAMIALGWLLRNHRDDGDEAERWFRRAAERDNISAMVALGWLLKDIRNDLNEAERWFRRAAASDDTAAIAGLGWILWDQKNVSSAEIEFRRAVERGHTGAMVGLGYLLREERRELVEAEYWFRQAATAGDTGAMAGLGWLLQEEHRNFDEAEQWFRRGAQAGHRGALIGLAWLLRTLRRFDESETWFRQAAEDGDAGAMGALGWLLEDRGRLADAEHWFRKAHAHGNDAVLESLASLLKNLNKDEDAEKFHRLRADSGDSGSVQRRSAHPHGSSAHGSP